MVTSEFCAAAVILPNAAPSSSGRGLGYAVRAFARKMQRQYDGGDCFRRSAGLNSPDQSEFQRDRWLMQHSRRHRQAGHSLFRLMKPRQVSTTSGSVSRFFCSKVWMGWPDFLARDFQLREMVLNFQTFDCRPRQGP